MLDVLGVAGQRKLVNAKSDKSRIKAAMTCHLSPKAWCLNHQKLCRFQHLDVIGAAILAPSLVRFGMWLGTAEDCRYCALFDESDKTKSPT